MYGDVHGGRKNDDCNKCKGCNKWFHKTCVEMIGMMTLKPTSFVKISCRDISLILASVRIGFVCSL